MSTLLPAASVTLIVLGAQGAPSAPPTVARAAPAHPAPGRAVPARPGAAAAAVPASRPAARVPAAAVQPEEKARERHRGGWFHASYLLDWGLTVAAGGAALAVDAATRPYVRRFDVSDRDIALSKRPDTVPGWALAFTGVVPLAVVGLWQISGPDWQEVHHAALGLSETFALTLLATVTLKRSVGRLRPDFLARCAPSPDGTCTGDPQEVRRGRESFPSGHTSLAFAGGTFLSLYLWGKLRPLRTGGALWKVLVVLAPLAAAGFVGLSRIWDHRHHWEDVAGGAVLGAGFALLGYRLNFPWPWAKDGGQPLRRTRWAVVPTAGPGQMGLLAQGRW